MTLRHISFAVRQAHYPSGSTGSPSLEPSRAKSRENRPERPFDALRLFRVVLSNVEGRSRGAQGHSERFGKLRIKGVEL